MEIPAVPSIDKDAKLKIDLVKPEEESLPQLEKRGIVLFVLGTIFGILILLGVVVLSYVYFNVSIKKEEKTVIEPTPIITEIPKKVEIVFEVLNASGKTGEAGKIKKRLEDLGYKVALVGNADKKKSGLELYLTSKTVDQKDELLINLKKKFPDITYKADFESLDVGARITIGF